MSSKHQQPVLDRPGSTTNDDVVMPTERSFAHVFAVFFVLIGLLPLWRGGDIRWWSLAIAAVFLALGYLLPAALRPLNKLWFKFGLLLHKIVNPLVLGAMFFLAVTPMALLMRLFGKRFLNMTFDKNSPTYWIERKPPGPSAQSARRQF
jgi:Saxitoxin biosynthesis operon protein SxtJ